MLQVLLDFLSNKWSLGEHKTINRNYSKLFNGSVDALQSLFWWINQTDRVPGNMHTYVSSKQHIFHKQQAFCLDFGWNIKITKGKSAIKRKLVIYESQQDLSISVCFFDNTPCVFTLWPKITWSPQNQTQMPNIPRFWLVNTRKNQEGFKRHDDQSGSW